MRDINELILNITGASSSAHAYIVEGRAGRERREFVDRIIEGLGCNSLDVVRMQMTGKNSYKVDDAAAFAERLEMGAYGNYLVGVIEDADSLTEVVQNKLLKTLEEPRDSVMIMLETSNRDQLLETVRSRCSVIRMQDHVEISEEDIDGGHEEIRAAAELLAEGSAAFCEFREAVEKSVKTKGDALRFIDFLEDILRDRMVSGDGPLRMAAMIETAEKTRVDIERDMDKSKALKRLCLELSDIR